MVPSRLPTISVIVPVYHGGEGFKQCLNALCRSDMRPAEIIVVADGNVSSDSETASAVGVHIIVLPERGGPARARNEGARAAYGEVLLFVDSDVLAPPGTVGLAAEAFARDPAIAALFGSYDDAPAAPDFLSQYKNLLHHYVHQNGREDAFTFWAGCGAVRRDVFLKLGGFDESYQRPSIEDIELGYRLKRAGYRVLLHKTLQVKHLKHWRLRSLLQSDIFDRALPWADLILRYGAAPDDLNLKYSNRFSVVLAWGVALGLACAPWKAAALAPAAVMAMGLWILNAPLYGFFFRRRGLGFAVGAALLHWLYYLYSSAAFAAALLRRLFRSGLTRAIGVRKAASSLDRP